MPEKKRSPGRSWASCFMGFGAALLAFSRKEKSLCWQPVPNKRLLSSSFGRAGKALRSQPHRPGKAELLGCRLGCCLPVADAQHRPKWQRRPVLNGPHWGPGPPVSLVFLMRCAPVRPQGLCPRTPTAFEKAGETFTPLRGCAFYSKLLYSWAISSSLVFLGLPGQQASA